MEKTPLFLEILAKNMRILEKHGNNGEIYVTAPKFSDFFDLIVLHPKLTDEIKEFYEEYVDWMEVNGKTFLDKTILEQNPNIDVHYDPFSGNDFPDLSIESPATLNIYDITSVLENNYSQILPRLLETENFKSKFNKFFENPEIDFVNQQLNEKIKEFKTQGGNLKTKKGLKEFFENLNLSLDFVLVDQFGFEQWKIKIPLVYDGDSKDITKLIDEIYEKKIDDVAYYVDENFILNTHQKTKERIDYISLEQKIDEKMEKEIRLKNIY